jgi:hypothetical protein
LKPFSHRVRSSRRANSLYSTPGIAIAAQLGAIVLILRDRYTKRVSKADGRFINTLVARRRRFCSGSIPVARSLLFAETNDF